MGAYDNDECWSTVLPMLAAFAYERTTVFLNDNLIASCFAALSVRLEASREVQN